MRLNVNHVCLISPRSQLLRVLAGKVRVVLELQFADLRDGCKIVGSLCSGEFCFQASGV